MRDAICNALVGCAQDEKFVFLTGDLGYKALEPLQAAAGRRFINAGVAEQNMVGMGAGLARSGYRPWLYSIAPFIYARPFEQIRNDICLHNLGVRLIGNGGGYGYGVMGSTHHAIDDYGALLGLQNMRVMVPAFDSDVELLVPRLAASDHPAYLRLGRDEKPADFQLPPYASWRRIVSGEGPTVLAVGPLAGSYIDPLLAVDHAERPNLWVVTELPITEQTVPYEFWADIERSNYLLVAEEHVAQGSVGHALAHSLLKSGRTVSRFAHLCAQGYPAGRYGSQTCHRKESGLDPITLIELTRHSPRTIAISISTPLESTRLAA